VVHLFFHSFLEFKKNKDNTDIDKGKYFLNQGKEEFKNFNQIISLTNQ
jgi:hypothetical protein